MTLELKLDDIVTIPKLRKSGYEFQAALGSNIIHYRKDNTDYFLAREQETENFKCYDTMVKPKQC